MTAADPAVLFSSDDGIAEIRFNRPARLNVVSVELAEAFEDAVGRAVSHPATRVIVVSAQGRSFMAGGDLTVFRGSEDPSAAAASLIHPMHRGLTRLAAAPAITLGSLKGKIAGAGMSLALNLDLAIAADDTTMNLAYARIGTSPDCGATYALPRLVGLRRALEIALLSEDIDAAHALDLGLVNRIVASADLERETAKLARRLASGAPAAQARTKELLRNSFDRSLHGQLNSEAQAFAQCATTDDFKRAVAAFLDRRNP